MDQGCVERPDGVQIPYVVQGDGTGPQLVFAHGLMGIGERMRSQVGPLLDAGWTIVTFDQRGHGSATPITDPAGYDPVQMGADVWAVADGVGFDRCWIGGGSMGAATSFRAATADPQRVLGLVQVCPALHNAPHPAVPLFDALADKLHEDGIDGMIDMIREWTTAMGIASQDLVLLDDLRQHDETSLQTALRSVPRWVLSDVPDAFGVFTFPVVVVGWDGDVIHPLHVSIDIASAAGVEPIQVDFASIQRDPVQVGEVLTKALAGVR